MNMNNIVLLYVKKVLNRLLSVQEELTGGVNNIRGDLSTVINSNVIKNGVVKSVQSGSTDTTGQASSDGNCVIEIPISSVNINKALFINSFNVKNAQSGIAGITVTLKGVSLQSNKIVVNAYATQMQQPASVRVQLYGNWQIVEFY